jgi:hypothetical protein
MAAENKYPDDLPPEERKNAYLQNFDQPLTQADLQRYDLRVSRDNLVQNRFRKYQRQGEATNIQHLDPVTIGYLDEIADNLGYAEMVNLFFSEQRLANSIHYYNAFPVDMAAQTYSQWRIRRMAATRRRERDFLAEPDQAEALGQEVKIMDEILEEYLSGYLERYPENLVYATPPSTVPLAPPIPRAARLRLRQENLDARRRLRQGIAADYRRRRQANLRRSENARALRQQQARQRQIREHRQLINRMGALDEEHAPVLHAPPQPPEPQSLNALFTNVVAATRQYRGAGAGGSE